MSIIVSGTKKLISYIGKNAAEHMRASSVSEKSTAKLFTHGQKEVSKNRTLVEDVFTHSRKSTNFAAEKTAVTDTIKKESQNLHEEINKFLKGLKDKQLDFEKGWIDTPRFNNEDIAKLCPVMEKYPQTVKKLLNETYIWDNIERARLNAEEICQLAPVMDKEPEITEKLLKEMRGKDPEFSADNICSLVPLIKNEPEITKKLMSITIRSFRGTAERRFGGSDIAVLVPFMKKEPEIIEKLLKEMKYDDVPRFDAADISTLVPEIKKEPEIVQKLINVRTKNGMARLRAWEIAELVPFMKKEPEMVEELLNITHQSYGYTHPRFEGSDIIDILPVKEKHPEIVDNLIKAADQTGKARFDGAEIAQLAPLDPKIVNKLLQETLSNGLPRFEAADIKKLLPVFKKYPKAANELLNITTDCKSIIHDGGVRFRLHGKRFDAFDIIELAPYMEKDGKTIKELMNITFEGDLRLNAREIIQLIPSMKTNPEAVEELLKLKPQSGRYPLFKSKHAAELAPFVKDNPELIEKLSNADYYGARWLADNIQEYSKIKDRKILSKIDEYINSDGFSDIHEKNADALVDTMNNIQGNYTTFAGTYFWSENKAGKTVHSSNMDNIDFARYLKSQGMSVEKLKKGEITKEFAKDLKERGLTTETLIKDFELGCKYDRMAEFIKINPNDEISKYLYREYYLKDLEKIGIDKKIIERCKSIEDKFNVRIMVSSDTKEASATLDVIEQELQKWQTASGGKAKYPPVIEFNTAKDDWYDTSSCYGKGAAAAYANWGFNGAQSYNRMTPEQVKYAMRHETTHTNDLTKQGHEIPSQYNMDEIMPKHTEIKEGKEINVCDAEKGKYYQEFINGGIKPEHVGYAYNSPAEFIAVASEGDMSKYSEEFKQLLRDFGMPDWELNLA